MDNSTKGLAVLINYIESIIIEGKSQIIPTDCILEDIIYDVSSQNDDVFVVSIEDNEISETPPGERVTIIHYNIATHEVLNVSLPRWGFALVNRNSGVALNSKIGKYEDLVKQALSNGGYLSLDSVDTYVIYHKTIEDYIEANPS